MSFFLVFLQNNLSIADFVLNLNYKLNHYKNYLLRELLVDPQYYLHIEIHFLNLHIFLNQSLLIHLFLYLLSLLFVITHVYLIILLKYYSLHRCHFYALLSYFFNFIFLLLVCTFYKFRRNITDSNQYIFIIKQIYKSIVNNNFRIYILSII